MGVGGRSVSGTEEDGVSATRSADAQVLNADGNAVPWPVHGAGDKGYRAQRLDEYLLERGITPVIPSKENEDRDARLVPFEKKFSIVNATSSSASLAGSKKVVAS